MNLSKQPGPGGEKKAADRAGEREKVKFCLKPRGKAKQMGIKRQGHTRKRKEKENKETRGEK